MAPDTPQTTDAPLLDAEPLEVRDKLRIRFRKSGALRLLSHHDLMRAFERMLRRAALPMRNSQGFHPKPRLVFALSLPLGVVGCEEVLELELSQVLPLDEVQERLTVQCPEGLQLLSFRRIEPRVTAQVRAFTYRIALPPERIPAVQNQLQIVLAAPECWVERTRPPARRVDIRPFLRAIHLTHPSPSSLEAQSVVTWLEIDLWLTQQGTARPEEVLTLLGVNDLLAAGAVLERARLELTDENISPAPSALESIP